MYYKIHTDQLRIVKKVYHWYIFRLETILDYLQYFNKFICFLTFVTLSLLYQITKTTQNVPIYF